MCSAALPPRHPKRISHVTCDEVQIRISPKVKEAATQNSYQNDHENLLYSIVPSANSQKAQVLNITYFDP